MAHGAIPRVVPGLHKRSVSLAGHATSLALEPEFWAMLEGMAHARALTLPSLIGWVDAQRGERSLASACRVAALKFAAVGT